MTECEIANRVKGFAFDKLLACWRAQSFVTLSLSDIFEQSLDYTQVWFKPLCKTVSLGFGFVAVWCCCCDLIFCIFLLNLTSFCFVPFFSSMQRLKPKRPAPGSGQQDSHSTPSFMKVSMLMRHLKIAGQNKTKQKDSVLMGAGMKKPQLQ